MTDANSHTTLYQYDSRKRLTKTTYPDTTTVTNTYDGPGNLASVTDQAGHVVQYTYDAANQLKTVVQTNSPNTSNNTNAYGYDPDGNLTGISDENNHITQMTFDQLYQLSGKTLPDGSLTETRSYDPAGNLLSLTHFNGVTTAYTYDSLNRLLTRATPGETTVSFTYTATGKYATSTDASGTTTYSYDSMDRLVTKATPQGTLNYTFDAAGHVATIASSNTNGASVSYTYDDLDRLSTVVDNRLPSGQNTTTYAYDPASNLATATLPNGLQSTYTYDSLNRVTSMATPVSSYSYQLDATGKRTQAVELTGRALNWTYDGIYRLTNETIASAPSGKNGAVSYSLDPVGNRLSDSSSISGIGSSSETFDADDRLSAETYDGNGNTLTTGGKTFAYDSENHLSMNSGAVSIVYDAFGNRVAKTVDGVTTRYLVEDDINPTGYPQVMEETVGGSVQRTYTYGLQRISEDQIMDSAWTASFYGYDGAGSVRQLTNGAGAVTDTYEYDAFGNEVNHTGTTPNDFLYRAEQYDPDLGLYYLRARYYNPPTGRFMSRDPYDGEPDDPVTLHKYLYAGGNPINAIDPMGWEAIIEYQAQPKNSGLQAHHVIERRFGKVIAQAMCTLAAVLTVEDHQVITNAWRAKFPYGMNYSTLTAGQIFEAAEVIYADWPEIDAAAKRCRVLAGI
jgi:RHS repeat-associated protein